MIVRMGLRLAAVALVATGCVAVLACHGSGTSTTSSGPVTTFTPDVPSPGPGPSMALLPGASSGASINVRVTVTGVSNFFGAAFTITYDSTVLLFGGMTNDTSILRSGTVTDSNLQFLENHQSTPGSIVITATRIDPTTAPPVDATATSDVVVLNFTALKAITAGAIEGRLDFGGSQRVEVCDVSGATPACGAATVNWSGGGISAQ